MIKTLLTLLDSLGTVLIVNPVQLVLMATNSSWQPVHKAEALLGISRKELFKMRDDGTLKLGTHYAAFPETRSRDTYRWNVRSVKKALSKLQATPA